MGHECALTASNVTSGGLPSLGNLSAYVRHVNAFPILSEKQELSLAKSLRSTGNLEAASGLVMSHLRLVVKIAREHAGYGLAQEDLIQEGNVGLMLAVKRFDPSHGVRLAAYAAIWIKSEIQEYILSNWRIVKIGSAKGLRKLFFNLRKLQEKLHGVSRLNQKEEIAKILGVGADEVERAVQWFAGGDVALLEESNDSESSSRTGFLLPAPESFSPEIAVYEKTLATKLPKELSEAVALLSERERLVVTSRYMSEKPLTLVDVSRMLGVSIERARQIEVAGLKHLRALAPNLRRWL